MCLDQERVFSKLNVLCSLAVSVAYAGFLAVTPAGATDAAKGASVPAQAVAALDALAAGPHPGFRAVHAKGVLCEGLFEPAPSATDVSRAAHFSGPPTPVLVRFSNFSGVPNAPDNDPLASPRGIAIKFMLADDGETDIVAHSYDGFPAATPEDFVAFVSALASHDPADLRAFLATHAAARAFVEAPKPPPVSYATESFFGVNTFAFANHAGETRYGRYRLVPLAGAAHLSALDAAQKAPGYLATDMDDRLRAGPIRFRLDLQLAAPGDTIADGSISWPVSRQVVPLGTLVIQRVVPNAEALQRTVLFTPLNLVDGILPSDDPLLVARSRSYRISHMRRSGEMSAAGPAP